MDDIPWIYVVMIFIAFVSWVSNRVKEAAAYRQQKRAERAAAERARRTTQPPEYDSPYRQETQPEPSTTQTYEEIFQELERRVTGELEKPQSTTPPPLPSQEEESFDEVPESLPEIPASPVPSAPPMSGARKRKKRSKTETSAALGKVLRDGQQLKNALILKEVLDKPVSMRR